MFLLVDNLLTSAEIQTLREIATQAKFIDGRLTNPHNTVKSNVIAEVGDPLAQKASQLALTALQRSEQARNFVLPQRVAAADAVSVRGRHDLRSARRYGLLAGRAAAHALRCFLHHVRIGSVDLRGRGTGRVHGVREPCAIKGKPGQAVFYPSTAIHQVAPVTAGERLVVITFIESQIPDQLQRDLIYTLGEVRALEGLKMDWRNRTQLEYVISNLQRMWSR